MKLKAFLLSVILFSLVSIEIQAQPSARATMKVNVQVLKAVGVEVVQPEIINLMEAKERALAKLSFRGIGAKDLMVNIADNLLLTNSEGDALHLKINKLLDLTDRGSFSLSVEGLPAKNMIKGIYTGILTATVEYF